MGCKGRPWYKTSKLYEKENRKRKEKMKSRKEIEKEK